MSVLDQGIRCPGSQSGLGWAGPLPGMAGQWDAVLGNELGHGLGWAGLGRGLGYAGLGWFMAWIAPWAGLGLAISWTVLEKTWAELSHGLGWSQLG